MKCDRCRHKQKDADGFWYCKKKHWYDVPEMFDENDSYWKDCADFEEEE